MTATAQQKALSYFDQAKAAALDGDVARLKKLLEEHGDEIKAEEKGKGLEELCGGALYPLSYKYKQPNPQLHPEIVQCLIDHGADVKSEHHTSSAGMGFPLSHLLYRYALYTQAGRSSYDNMHASAKSIIDTAEHMIKAGAKLDCATNAGNGTRLTMCGFAYATMDMDIIRFMERKCEEEGVVVSPREKLQGIRCALALNSNEHGYPKDIKKTTVVLKHLLQQVTPVAEFRNPDNRQEVQDDFYMGIPFGYEKEKEHPASNDEKTAYEHLLWKLASSLAALPGAENTWNDRYNTSFRGNLEKNRQDNKCPNLPHYYQHRNKENDDEYFLRQEFLQRVKAQLAELPGHKNRFRLINDTEEYAFDRVAAVAYVMAQGLDSHIPHTSPDFVVNLLKNEKEDWSKVYKALPENVLQVARTSKDAFSGITRALVLPEMIRQFRARGIKPESLDIGKLESAILPEVVETLIGTRTLKTMLELSEAWHDQIARIESIRKLPRSGSWPTALAEDFKATDGTTIHFLTSAEEVKAHAEKMKPCCAESYMEEFKTGKMHIACVSDASGKPISTLGLKKDVDPAKILKVTENQGPGNKELEKIDPANVAVDEFLARVRADEKSPDKLKIDFAGIDAEHKKRALLRKTTHLDLIGHDPLAEDALTYEKKYLDAYSNVRLRTGSKAPFVPGHGKTEVNYTPQNFLQDTGLSVLIEECVNSRIFQRSVTKQGCGIV